jgi:hypothetical protein
LLKSTKENPTKNVNHLYIFDCFWKDGKGGEKLLTEEEIQRIKEERKNERKIHFFLSDELIPYL